MCGFKVNQRGVPLHMVSGLRVLTEPCTIRTGHGGIFEDDANLLAGCVLQAFHEAFASKVLAEH